MWAQGSSPPTATLAEATAPQTVPPIHDQQYITIGLDGAHAQQALGDLFSLLLFDQGFTVTQTVFSDTQSLLSAIDEGNIDLAIALPVDAMVLYYGLPLNALPTDGDRLRQLVNSQATKQQATWLPSTLIAQDYVIFAVEDRNEASQQMANISLPQLGAFQKSMGRPLTICAGQEDDALLASTLAALNESYRIQFDKANQQILERAALARALTSGACDLFFGLLTARQTDNAQLRLHALPDPDRFFPSNRPTLVARQAVLTAEPTIALLWAALAAIVDETALAQLQTKQSSTSAMAAQQNDTKTVANEDQSARNQAVAYQFLLDRGLIQLPTITVGSRDETAQQLLGAMIVQLLEAAGYPIVDQTGTFSTAEVLTAVESGHVDIVIALLGDMLTSPNTILLNTLPKDVTGATVLTKSRQDDHDLTALTPAPFSLTKVLLVDQDLAGLGITTLSRLAIYMDSYDAPFAICIDSEFFSHPLLGLSGLEEFYSFHFDPDKILLMDEDTIFPAIQERQCQVTVGTITDGRVAAWQLLPLLDDKGFFPSNNPLPIVRQSLLDRQPRLVERVESYLPYLDTATMQQLTRLVELGVDGTYLSGDEETVAQVAKTFLIDHQLLETAQPAKSSSNAGGRVKIEQLDPEQLNEFEEIPSLPNARKLAE